MMTLLAQGQARVAMSRSGGAWATPVRGIRPLCRLPPRVFFPGFWVS